MKLDISLVIPIYNMEKWLRECLDSVRSQTLKDIEIICINDGSTDNSCQILNELATSDSRIIIISKQNEGVGTARNCGMDIATGEFISFMDPDDCYPQKETLKLLYESATKHNVMISGGSCICIGETGEKRIYECDYGVTRPAGLVQYLDYQYDYQYWCYIYSRRLLEENKIRFPEYKRFQDPPFYTKAMAAAGKFYSINEPTYCYRVMHESKKISAEKTSDFLKGINDNLVFSKENKLPKLHYITAMRVYNEGSYMLSNNILCSENEKLLAEYVHVLGSVDIKWLETEGFSLPSPFLPGIMAQLLTDHINITKLRKYKLIRAFMRSLR